MSRNDRCRALRSPHSGQRAGAPFRAGQCRRTARRPYYRRALLRRRAGLGGLLDDAFIYARVGNRADAEDLTQEVAIKAIPRSEDIHRHRALGAQSQLPVDGNYQA
jgi:hypothetical protein